MPRARGRSDGSEHVPTLIGAGHPRGRQDACRTPSARCARRSTSAATTRRRRGASFANERTAPLGPVACIAPWNFPLAIFIGEVARRARRRQPGARQARRADAADRRRGRALFHAPACPRDALQLLPGDGETVGAALVADPRVAGVVFTGSTEVARLINRQLAERPAATPVRADRRDRRPERDDRRQLGAARAGGRGRASPRRSTAPASAARRCACSACRRTSPTACCAMLKGAMDELAVGDPTGSRPMSAR